MSAVLLVLVVTAVASTAQTVAGFGFALIAMPLLVTMLGVQDSVALAALLGVANAALVARAAFRHVPWRTVVLLLVGSFAGMPLGLLILFGLDADSLRLIVAVVSIVMAAAIAAGLAWTAPGTPGILGVGLISGVLNTSTAMNGPPIVLFLQARGYPPTVFRGALSTFFVLNGIVSLSMLAGAGVIGSRALQLAAAGLPVLLLASWFGHRLLERVSAAAFRRFVLGVLVASALISLIDTSLRVWRGG